MRAVVNSSCIISDVHSSTYPSSPSVWGPSHRRDSSVNHLQHGWFPRACSSPLATPLWIPSGTGCSSLGPLWSHKRCWQSCPSLSSSLLRPTPLPRPTPSQAYCGSQSPSGIRLLCGSSPGCRQILASLWPSTGHGGVHLHHGLR